MFGSKPKKIKTKKILFMAAVGSYNLWDELILKWEVEYIKKQYWENIEITVFTYDPDSTLMRDASIRYVSYFPNHIGKKFLQNIGYFFHNIWLIARADVLIIGGGGIIFDNEPGVSFTGLYYQWLLRTRVARIAKTTLLFWGIGLEVTDVANKMRLKNLFKDGDLMLVRDQQSKWLLDALEISSIQVQDIVFLHEPPAIARPISPIKLVGISLRWGFLRGREMFIPELYESIVAMWYKPIFLLFSTSGEEEQNDSLFIRKMMLGKTYNTTKNITQTLDMYPFLHAVIGMRLHAGILSTVHDIPYIPISYGPKTDDLIQMLEIEHLSIRAQDFSLELFQERWQSLTDNYDREKENITQKHLSIKNSLLKNLKNI